METTYPQQTIGTTLLCVANKEEYRRVYLRKHEGYDEVGEFSCGILTQDVEGAPAHWHFVYVYDAACAEFAKGYFLRDDRFLADYMDELDARGMEYGYANDHVGSYVAFRPARPQKPLQNPQWVL